MTLTRNLSRRWDRDGAASARAARAALVCYEAMGEPGRVAQRQREIAALPTVEWKGRTLYTIRCTGTTGKGPHVLNVPEALLWALIDLRAFRCPYHA